VHEAGRADALMRERASTPPGMIRRSPTPKKGLDRAGSPGVFKRVGSPGVLERVGSPIPSRSPSLPRMENSAERSLKFKTLDDENREKPRPDSRGRSSQRKMSPLFVQPMRASSEGALRSAICYEEECKRRLILPKFARTAQCALRGEELDLGELSLGDAQLEALLSDKSLVPTDKIRSWRLCGDRITHVGAVALGSSFKHGVRVLNLARNDLGIRGVEAIRGLTVGHQLTQLRSLNLSGNGLKNDALAVLCDALLECQLLLRLDLNCNDIREGTSLANLIAGHVNLIRLSLHGNFLLACGGAALFRGLLQNIDNGGKLADLDIAWNGLNEGNAVDCAKVLSDVLARPSTLFHLDLSYNGMDAQCCEIISRGMRDNHHLYGLHMVGNAIMMDSNGFLMPLTSSGKDNPAVGTETNHGMMFGDPRSAPRQLVGAARRSSVCQECSTTHAHSDEDVLRDRDPLEHQGTCWACEGWEKVELRWLAELIGPRAT
jgi:hypothetical protein